MAIAGGDASAPSAHAAAAWAGPDAGRVTAEVADWFGRASRFAPAPQPAALRAALGSTSVSVVLPARDEATTIAAIVAALRRELCDEVPLVSEVVVVDSGSTDDTAALAAAAGARVVDPAGVLAGLGPGSGKGEAMWKGLAATTGDLVVYLDADVQGFRPSSVCALLAPLVADPAVQLVKGCYTRPLQLPGGAWIEDGGGRVTELMVRPLLATFWPQLTGLVTPLAGECAARRSLLEELPFVRSYGVELGLLVDTLELAGLDALAQADLGRRVHRNRDTAALGRMAAAILTTALARVPGRPVTAGGPLVQYTRTAQGWQPQASHPPAEPDRPPLATVRDYRRAAA